MCVIVVMKKKLADLDTLKACETHNPDGAGIAWQEDKQVHWVKGITAKEVYRIAKQKGTPCVAHFRIGTVGEKSKELTHPFPIDKECSTALSGATNRVLFHNGHWRDWEATCMSMVLHHNIVFPNGQWSDSRAMAWLVNHSNPSFLKFTDQKVILFGADSIKSIGKFEEIDGVYYSNSYWKYSNYKSYSGNNYQQSYLKDTGPQNDQTLFHTYGGRHEKYDPEVELSKAMADQYAQDAQLEASLGKEKQYDVYGVPVNDPY